MSIESLQELMRATPFEPFAIIMANGERLEVPHQEFIRVLPNRRTVLVALPNGGARWVNWQLVAGMEKKGQMA